MCVVKNADLLIFALCVEDFCSKFGNLVAQQLWPACNSEVELLGGSGKTAWSAMYSSVAELIAN